MERDGTIPLSLDPRPLLGRSCPMRCDAMRSMALYLHLTCTCTCTRTCTYSVRRHGFGKLFFLSLSVRGPSCSLVVYFLARPPMFSKWRLASEASTQGTKRYSRQWPLTQYRIQGEAFLVVVFPPLPDSPDAMSLGLHHPRPATMPCKRLGSPIARSVGTLPHLIGAKPSRRAAPCISRGSASLPAHCLCQVPGTRRPKSIKYTREPTSCPCGA